MSIQFKLFTLSAFEVTQDESSLNLFLRQHRVLKVHREFVQDQQNAYWSLLVEYLDSAQACLRATESRPVKVEWTIKKFLALKILRYSPSSEIGANSKPKKGVRLPPFDGRFN